MAPVIRPAQPADLGPLLRMHEEFSLEDGHPFEASAARSALGGLLGEASFGRVWVIEEDGRALGYLAVCFGYSLEFRGRDAFVDEIWVRREARGQGLGREALRVAEAECARLGVRAMHLEVRRDNPGAQRLYRGAGFVDRENYLMTKKLR